MIIQGMKFTGFYKESVKGSTGYTYNYIMTGTYSSLDVPVLLNITFINRPFLFGLNAGPHLSLPVGKFETAYKRKDHSESVSYDIDGIMFGATGGFFAGFPAGAGNIVADIRLVFDFNALQLKYGSTTLEFGNRRGVAATVGYELMF
jgi:hypothetical protein